MDVGCNRFHFQVVKSTPRRVTREEEDQGIFGKRSYKRSYLIEISLKTEDDRRNKKVLKVANTYTCGKRLAAANILKFRS